MKRYLAIGVVGLLAGCAASSDMMNNDFPAIAPIAPPKAMIGTWTGSMGPYLTTMRFEGNGAGVMCYSWNGKDVLARLKYDGQQIRISDGMRLDVSAASPTSLKLRSNYYMGSDFSMYRDDDLSSAAPYCTKNL